MSKPSKHRRLPRRVTASAAVASVTLLAVPAESEVMFSDGFEVFAGALNFVVAWQDDADGNGFSDIRVGTVRAPAYQTRVNVNAGGEQAVPVLAVADNGDFVVAWADDTDNNGFFDIFARGFSADGSERLPTFKVNTVSSGQQLTPDIAMAPNGDFVIVWADDADNNNFFQIRGRGFFANGSQKFGDGGAMNNLGAGDQLTPVVGMADDGSFVVAWIDDQDNDKLFEISARRFTAAGAPRLGQFQVNPVSSGLQLEPAIGVGANGDFVIAWRDDRDLNFFSQIRASAYDADGVTAFQDRTLNAIGTANQYDPAVAMADDASFVATWVDQGQQIRSRLFDPDGTPRSGDLLVNNDLFRMHYGPSVALAADDSFVVVWQAIDASGDWSLRGRPILPDGEAGTIVNIASARGGDQRLPRVAIR